MAHIFHRAFYNSIDYGLRFTVYGKKNLNRQPLTVTFQPFSINQKGSVLILVLWVIAMLTLITAFYSQEAKISRNLGQISWDSLQGREAVHSVLLLVAPRLKSQEDVKISEGDSPSFVPDGSWHTLNFGGHELQFSLEDEAGKLDINKATEEQLRDVFTGILTGEKQNLAYQIIDAILDWRDQDNMERYAGSEEEVYQTRHPFYMPANAPFRIIDELLLVDGMTHELFYGPLSVQSAEDENLWQGGLKDIFTVYNQTNTVSSARAPAPLKEFLKTGLSDNLGMPNVLRLRVRYGVTGYEVFFKLQASSKGYQIIVFNEMKSQVEKN